MPPTEPRRLAFVIHGARAEHPGLRHAVTWVRSRGHVVEPHVTWEAGDAERMTRSAVADGADTVVAVGGDGTVNEVVNGLSGSGSALGIIPLGTANDFARQAGIPFDPDHAMDVILRRNPVRVDTADLNRRRFLNVSSGGVGAEATAETSAEAKEALGMLAYAVTGVRKLRELQPRALRFVGPGFSLDGQFLLFAVGNARETGGGTCITPRASVTDGLLDLCAVEAMPRAEFARLVLRIKRGEHLDHPAVHYVQLPAVTIAAEEAVTVNLDGEPRQERTLVYEVRRGDLLAYVARLPGDQGDS